MIDVPFLFASIGFIIVLGFVGHYIFRKTKIPDVIWLMLLGLFIGPVFHVVQNVGLSIDIFISFSSYFAALAIMTILFEGGLNTDLLLLIKQSPRSLLLALSSVLGSIAVIAPAMYYFFNWPLLYGMLLGAIVGGSSSPIVVSITQGMGLEQKVRTILNLESTLTDALCIVLALAITPMILSGKAVFNTTFTNVVASFSIGAVIGVVSGVFWLFILKRIKGKPFEYMLTLAVLFILYAFVESMKLSGGVAASGAIGALTFGLVLGNSKEISRMFKFRKKLLVNGTVRKFHSEITFLIRSFFFVYLGLLVTINQYLTVVLGISVTALLLIVRFLIVRLSIIKSGITEREKNIMSVMMPRGLAAAVMVLLVSSQFAGTASAQYSNLFKDIVFVVIIASIVVTTAGISAINLKRITGESKEKHAAGKKG